MQSVINYMLQHLNQSPQISDLSAVAGVSSSRLFAWFKSAAGRAPMDFFIRLRMQRACELPTNESLHTREVAAWSGYGDQFCFSRLFKLVNGMSPLQYRNVVAELEQTVAHEKLESGFVRRSEHLTLPSPWNQTRLSHIS
jgi:AraC-like DNA-binding protein